MKKQEEQIIIIKRGKGRFLSPEEERRFKDKVVDEYKDLLNYKPSSWPIAQKKAWKSAGALSFSLDLKLDGSVADFHIYSGEGDLEDVWKKAHIFRDLPKEITSALEKILPDFLGKLKEEGLLPGEGKEPYISIRVEKVENSEKATFYAMKLSYSPPHNRLIERKAFVILSRAQDADHDCYSLANFLKRVSNSYIYLVPFEQAPQKRSGMTKTQKIAFMEKQISSLKELNESMGSELEKLKKENIQLKAKLTTVEGLLSTAEADIKDLQAKKNAYEHYSNKLKSSAEEAIRFLREITENQKLPPLFKKRFKELMEKVRACAMALERKINNP